MTDVLGILVGAAVSAVSAAGGYFGARKISREEQLAAADAELRRAAAAYLGVLYQLVATLQNMPDPEPGVVSRMVDSMSSDQARWVREQGVLARYPHLANERARFSEALARMHTLDVPADLREAVDESARFVEELSRSRAGSVAGRWPEIYEALHRAVRALS